MNQQAGMVSDIEALLRRDEGCRYTAYLDSRGELTIGIGHNLEVPIPEEAVNVIFQHDLRNARGYAGQLEFHKDLSPERQAVVVSMIFNLGWGRFLDFKRMLIALSRYDFDLAAAEMRDSRWHKQLPQRAERLATQMETDTWI